MSAEATLDLELEIAHVLLIDVVGYSKLLVNEQIELLQDLNQIVRSSECFQAAETKGKLIRVPTGDGMALLFFQSPEEPVRCALEISRTLQEHPHIQLRMGVHSCPVNQVTDVNDKTNIAGAGINVAQRVMDCGDAGHILLAGHIAEDLTHYRQWQPYLHDLGECQVKHGLRLHLVNLYKDNLGNPHLPDKLKRRRRWKQTFGVSIRPVITPRWPRYVVTAVLLVSAVALAISFSVFYRRGSPGVARSSSGEAADAGVPIAEKSIAVLPFENLSEDKANAYFAEGIQDEILTRLSKLADLKVISRTSTQRYKSAPTDLREIAKQLGVANILEGSVQKSSDQVRITVQLINALNDSHLWAETYDRKLIDVFQIETDLAQKIASSLEAKLTGREKKEIATRGTTNPEAYDAFLHVLSLLNRQGVSDLEESIKFSRRAVELDPNYAEAWCTLAFAESQKYFYPDHSEAQLARARAATETAIRLAPDSAEAAGALGVFNYYCLKNYDAALAQLEIAHERAPNNANVLLGIGNVKRRKGLLDESIAVEQQDAQLDPLNEDIWVNIGRGYRGLRRFDEARTMFDHAHAIAPTDAEIAAQRAETYVAQGNLERA